MDRADDRRRQILARLATTPSTKVELGEYLSVTNRTIDKHITQLQRAYPGQLVAERDGRAKRWRFLGDPDAGRTVRIRLEEPQLIALIAARGMLRTPPASGSPIERRGQAYTGPLAEAIDRLLLQTEFAQEAATLAPNAISISRFGAAPVQPETLLAALSAIRVGEGARFRYVKATGEANPVHVRPLRLTHIAGEWYLFAWATDQQTTPGKIKQYRCSRIRDLHRTAALPPQCPSIRFDRELDAMQAEAFRATGSSDPKDRIRITLIASPLAWAHLHDRTWGSDQKVSEPGATGCPPTWRRLSFVSTGYEEAKYWALSFGAEIQVEAPAKLRDWLAAQATALLACYRPAPTPTPKS